ncbi:MAG: hypothetical protein MI974_06350 [Chitinophagales bacterium]|nr:hypothetical protein [Chitinophagales bacterium]
MKYFFIILSLFICSYCALQGRSIDSTLWINQSLTAQFEEEKLTKIYSNKDGVFEVVVGWEASEVFFQLVKSNGTKNTFNVEFDPTTQWSFKRHNNETTLKTKSHIEFKNNYLIFGTLRENFVEGILTFKSEEESLQYKVEIKREKTDFNAKIGTILYYEDVSEMDSLRLDTVYVDSSFEINMLAFLVNEIGVDCPTSYKIDLKGAKEENVTSGKFDLKSKHEINKKYKATQAGAHQGKIHFNYDCPHVNGDGFTIPIKYVILENESTGFVMPLIVFAFLIPFIGTILIAWFIRRQKRKKTKNLGKGLKADKPDDTGHKTTELNAKAEKRTASSKQENGITKQVRNQVLNELLEGKHLLEYDSRKISVLKEKWIEAERTSSAVFGNYGKADKMRRQNQIKGRHKGTQRKDVLINDLQSKNKVLLEQQEQDKATIKGYILEKEKLNEKLRIQSLKLDKYAPYPSFIEGYFDVLERIYQFAQQHLLKIQRNSIFYNLLDNILHVKTQGKAISPIFNHARKDEYFCGVLKLTDTVGLQLVNKDTFFNYFIKGRGFHLINIVARLYAYSILSSDLVNTRGRMIREGFDIEKLGTLYMDMNVYLNQTFGVKIYLPTLLADYFQKDKHTKTSFSYLAEYYSFNNVEEGIIYDIERIGFIKSDTMIQQAMIKYKL